ncbi:uncharacterized protein [Haliotis cracherodii]|uniref:uncharacterized protein n=1 Tax=Haliotis cracherodii TaxID=6455 RepID=UPI0039E76E80
MSSMTVFQCLAYVVAVNAVTTVWVYIGHVKWLSFQTLALAMFLPTAMALCFTDDLWSLVVRVLGFKQPLDAVAFSGVAVYSVAAMVGACVVIDLLMGWAKLNLQPDYQVDVLNGTLFNGTFFSSFLRAAGEEVGWRCFLLPSLMSHFSPGVALFLGGVAWGLFHVPVLILMTSRLSTPMPRITVLVQCLSVMLSAFPHGWVAIKSGYSVWASGLMHALWNQVNPVMLGSIYTQAPGIVVGPQWLINGEGLAGCIVLLPLAIWLSVTM